MLLVILWRCLVSVCWIIRVDTIFFSLIFFWLTCAVIFNPQITFAVLFCVLKVANNHMLLFMTSFEMFCVSIHYHCVNWSQFCINKSKTRITHPLHCAFLASYACHWEKIVNMHSKLEKDGPICMLWGLISNITHWNAIISTKLRYFPK